ncbi:MAG: zinc-dependent alcohol dehydrogenase family protein [Alphaproteobacteria bacterium]|nr:zinc-dependent alcohol dehydrogenase family protein [Alphaproteobacteria bacterium]
MRALMFDRFGGPADVLQLANLPEPVAAPGEVLVRMRLRPINPADRLYIQGRYGTRPTLPAVPGVEGVGEVVALGPGVTAPAIGCRVVFWRVRGTWQEFVTVPAADVQSMPANLDDAQAAQFIAGPLAATLVFDAATAGATPGWVVQSAAGSSFAGLLRAIAVRSGWRIVDLVRRPEQAVELAAAGVEHALATEDADIEERLRVVTGGGARVALDAVGGATGTLLAKVLGPGGTMIVHGVLDGRPIEVHPGWLIAKGATIAGFWLDAWIRSATVARRTAAADRALPLVADGTLTCPVDAVYDLADVQAALAHANGPGRRGKVLLRS